MKIRVASGSGERKTELRRGRITCVLLCCVLIAAFSGFLLYRSHAAGSQSGNGEDSAAEQLLLHTKQVRDGADAPRELSNTASASPVVLSSTRGQKDVQPVSLWSVIRRAVTRGAIHREEFMTDAYGNKYYDVMVNDRIGAYDEEDTASITFKLDNNYTRLTGTLFRNDEHWTEKGPYPFVRIFCDDYRVAYETLNAREGPFDFDIDVTGVKTLRIEFDCILSYGYAGALANCMITPKRNFTPPTMTSDPKTEFGKVFLDYLEEGTSLERSEKVDLILDNYNGRIKKQDGRRVLKDGFTEKRYSTGALKLVYSYADGILYAVSIYENGTSDFLYFLAYWDGTLIGVQDMHELYGKSWYSPDDQMFPAYEALFTYVDPYSGG